MKFTKMHGAGNDFIIIDNRDKTIPLEKMGMLAEKLCHRRLSIGADGLMIIDEPTLGGDYKMHFFNADGSAGEMCGNGARCIARYGYENGLAGEMQRIEATAGIVVGHRLDKRTYKVRLNDVTTLDLHRTATVDGVTYALSYVELGDPGIPHIAVEIENLQEKDKQFLFQLGRMLRHDPQFPKGTNVNFYEILGEDEVVELTYERGVEDFTMACGTGTGSMVAVLTAKKKVSGHNVKVHVPGGQLMIDLGMNDAGEITDVFLIGPTNKVAEGEILDEDLDVL